MKLYFSHGRAAGEAWLMPHESLRVVMVSGANSENTNETIDGSQIKGGGT